jgi:hypothetical protein
LVCGHFVADACRAEHNDKRFFLHASLGHVTGVTTPERLRPRGDDRAPKNNLPGPSSIAISTIV